MTRTEPLYLAVALAMTLGCKGLDPSQAPRPTAAEPAQGFEASEATIDIVGSAFNVRAVQHADARGSSVDASYRAWLGTCALLDVVWLDRAGCVRACRRGSPSAGMISPSRARTGAAPSRARTKCSRARARC